MDWGVHLGVPFAKECLCRLHLRVIDVDLVAQAAELLQPRDADCLARHRRIECVLAQPGILLSVSEGADSPLDGEDEVFCLVALEGITRADFAVPLELDDGVLETTGLESDDWCATNEELMLDNTSWLEERWHEAEIGTSVDK